MKLLLALVLSLNLEAQIITTLVAPGSGANDAGQPAGVDYFGNLMVIVQVSSTSYAPFLLAPGATTLTRIPATTPTLYNPLMGLDGSLFGFTFSGYARRSPDGVQTMLTKYDAKNNHMSLAGEPMPEDRMFPVAVGPDGSLYLYNQLTTTRMYRVRPNGKMDIIAGNGRRGRAVPGPAVNSPLPITIPGVCVAASGNIYLAYTDVTDSAFGPFDFVTPNPQVMLIDPAGTMKVFAGTGKRGFTGDGGPATAAQLYGADSCAFDNGGNVLIAEGFGDAHDYGRRIRIVTPDGKISTFAGTNTPGFSPSGTSAGGAQLQEPSSLFNDKDGNLYFHVENAPAPDQRGPGYIRRIGYTSAVQATGPSLGGITSAASPIAPAPFTVLKIARNTFASLYGSRLTAKTTDWSTLTVNQLLPININGVSATIGGNPTPIHFVSPSQVNILVPADQPTGYQMLLLTASTGEVVYIPVNVVDVQPSLFALGSDSSKTAAIFDAVTYQLALPAGTVPGVDSAAPRAGAYLVMYASGLGDTKPAAQPRQLITAPLPLANLSSIHLSLSPAASGSAIDLPVLYGGLVFAGVYQLNTQLPANLAAGDYDLTITASSVAAPIKYRVTVAP